jgi:hypothetical protein
VNTADCEWTEVAVVWTMPEALALIRQIQGSLRPFGFHVALAGGVLNTDQSFKDLDLIFVPLTNEEAPAVDRLISFLMSLPEFAGLDTEDNGGTSHSPNPYSPDREQYCCNRHGKRIDVFIV